MANKLPVKLYEEVKTLLRLRRAMDAESITVETIATVLNCSEKTVKNKMAGRSEFTFSEARLIKGLFPKYDLDYLLSEELKA